MTSEAGTGEKRSRLESESETPFGSWDECCENDRHKRPRLESKAPEQPHSLTDSIQILGASDPLHESRGQEQTKEESPVPRDQPQHVSASPGSLAHTDDSEGEEMVITRIRATDIALGLRRIPAGFYILVHHNNLEWKTEHKRSFMNDDVIEWTEPIQIPSDLSATVSLGVYASIEFQSMSSAGEQLRNITIAVQQLLDRSEKDIPFTFFPKDGDIISPCSSMLVTVERRKRKKSTSSASRICGPYHAPDEVEDATNHGQSALSQYRKYGDRQDLERSIKAFERTYNICPPDHRCRAAVQSNLAMAKFMHWKEDSTNDSLEISIGLYHDVLATHPVDHIDRPSTLIQLAMVYLARFKSRGDETDATRAKELLHEATKLSSLRSHENRAATFMLQLHTERKTGSVRERRQSFAGQDLASRFAGEDPWNLSSHLLRRFYQLGNLSELQQVIVILEELVRSTPVWDGLRSVALGNLSSALSCRYEHLRDPSDLEEAISKGREANDLIPLGHSNKHASLNNLGVSFLSRFERLGELSDLENGILMLKDTIDLTPHDHPEKPGYLNNLGTSLKVRFYRLGELRDIEDAISTLKGAVNLLPRGHPHKSTCLSNLGNCFRTRFEHLGELSDIEEAISVLADAVRLTLDSHSHKACYLQNLGRCLSIRFDRCREPSDLEDAISVLMNALDRTSYGHADKPTILNSLGLSLLSRFKHFGRLSDLEDAISTLTDAVYLTFHDHPEKPVYLSNLANAFLRRFERFGELTDLQKSISKQSDAVTLIPHGHPYKPTYLNSLGVSFTTLFRSLGESSALERAILLYSHASSSSSGPVYDRFCAARNWISIAQNARHSSLLHAYSVAISLLPQLAWIGLSLTTRYRELLRAADVVREAAAAALDLGLPEIAVEWLEQGRSIVWGELFQLRSSYEELSSTHPDYARRLQGLSAALIHSSAAHEKPFIEQTHGGAHRPAESLQQGADRHRMLAIERDRLLQEIRGLPGFERFLLQKDFSVLRASAHSGPVVILNAAETRCDALIVLADVDHVIHVPLPSFPFERFAPLQRVMKRLLRHARVIRFDERDGNPESVASDGIGWESILSPLWKCVVKPVLDALAISTLGDPSRVFWCPTGPFMFLPIHAAGFYDARYSQPGNKVFDFAVSSYVPALNILIPSSSPTVAPSHSSYRNLRFLVVRQPSSDGLPQLPGVATELKHIKEVIRVSASAHTNLMEPSVGTAEEVLRLMKKADWVHFACHGIQDGADSGLCLAEGRRLKLRHIVALSRPRGGLAFLSACQTATGEENLSDEAIHIAAGMLYAGYGGIIGTMWSISDSLAPIVARDVYEQLFRNGTRPDYREAARALHEAINRVRGGGSVSFVEWLPFIHVGL